MSRSAYTLIRSTIFWVLAVWGAWLAVHIDWDALPRNLQIFLLVMPAMIFVGLGMQEHSREPAE